MCACTNISELAIKHFEDNELVTHCFAFMEMLDVNTMHLRAYLKCLRWIHQSNNSTKPPQATMSMSSLLEHVVLHKLDADDDDLQIRDLDAVRMVYEMKNEKMPTSFLAKIAANRGWFQMLAVAMYLNYNLEQVLDICDQTPFSETTLRTNLKRALQWEIIIISDGGKSTTKRRNSLPYREKRKMTLNKNEISSMSSSISSNETLEKQLKQSPFKFVSDADLFATIIRSSVDNVVGSNNELMTFDKFHELMKNPNKIQLTTNLNLLRNALRLHRPILAVLAAMNSCSNEQMPLNVHHYCWIAWTMTVMESYDLIDNARDLQHLSRELIEFSVINGFIRALHHGMSIFFPESNFNIFIEYLMKTKSLDFSSDSIDLLQNYFVALRNDDVELLCLNNDKIEIQKFSAVLLVHHLQFGFDSKEYQRLMLTTLCESDIDFSSHIDFHFIDSVLEILNFTAVEMDIALFTADAAADVKQECERQICEQLVAHHEYSKAMKAADLFNLPKDNIIYESWIWRYEIDVTFDLDRYDRESDQYSLAPEIVINFYIHVAGQLDYDNPKKYKILKKILDVIKKHHLLFPNESFDRDWIEYEMVLSFLKSPLDIHEVDELYYSVYFETIMSKERYVLYKSFLDLKEMAGVEELTVSNKVPLSDSETEKLNSIMNRLLDDGDIVQALRIQVIFSIIIIGSPL